MGVIGTAIRSFYKTIEPLMLSLIKMLPDRVLLRIKSRVSVIKRMDYQRGEIFLHIDSRIEYETRLNSCMKEPETIQWIESYFQEGQVFYDVGANVGAYSLVASKFLNGNIQVYAFEPGSATYSQLCKNININNFQHTITPLPVALSDTTAIDVFNYHNLAPGGALHTLGDPIDYKGEVFEPVSTQPVLAYRLDDLIRQFSLPVPNHIKIDVDGIEFKILTGGKETLCNPVVRSLLVELEESTSSLDSILVFLADMGFEVTSKTENGSTHNYIFHRLPISGDS